MQVCFFINFSSFKPDNGNNTNFDAVSNVQCYFTKTLLFRDIYCIVTSASIHLCRAFVVFLKDLLTYLSNKRANFDEVQFKKKHNKTTIFGT